MLIADQLECQRGEHLLFSGLSFSLASGQLLHVHGDNGSGKTSLLRILAGLLPASAGQISWRGQTASGAAFRAELCYLGHHNAIKDDLTPLENLLASVHLADEPLSTAAALAALAQAGLGGREDLPCKYLSQGQKRRVALARLLGEKRTLWILDEPFVALDAFAITWLAELIAKHLQRDGCVVMTTHQPISIPGVSAHSLRLGSPC